MFSVQVEIEVFLKIREIREFNPRAKNPIYRRLYVFGRLNPSVVENGQVIDVLNSGIFLHFFFFTKEFFGSFHLELLLLNGFTKN